MGRVSRRALGHRAIVAFGVIAAFVLLNGILAYYHTARVYGNGAHLAEGYERRAVAAHLLSIMRDAETGQRGFLLTGEDRYLDPYHQAQDELGAALQRLKSLGSLSPEEDKLFAALRAAIATKTLELTETIGLRRQQGFEAARAAVLTDRGRQAMLDVRAVAAAIDDLEARDIGTRAEQSRMSYRSAMVARALATLVGLAVIFGAYRSSERSARDRSAHAEQSHAQAERFRVTLASIGDAVVVTDAEARVRFMNPVAEALTGWGSDWDGRAATDVFRIRDETSGRAGRDPVQRVLAERQIVALENHTELVKRDGDVVPIDDSAAPIFGSDGELTGVVLVFRDITQRRKAERLVHTQKEALEEGDRRKDEFLAVLAHELRNPLAALRNASEVLRLARADSAESDSARGIIERQVRHMARMVDDLIDVARVSSGRMTLRLAPVEIREVIQAATETTASLFAEKRHRLEVGLPEGSVFVHGDTVRLAQVLTNLLGNAARYTEPGGQVAVTVSTTGPNVVVAVRDNGMGISDELLPHVFDLFRQGHRLPGPSQGGLGIGLTLARRIVEMHGGTIEGSSPGLARGSNFVVTLPSSVPPQQRPSEAEAEPAKSTHRVLVVEDNADARASLESFLRLSGYEVLGASDGGQALLEAKRFRPTVALVDLGLPDVSGYDLARRLRADPDLGRLTLVAITGWAQEEDRQQSVAAGFDHHLVKPVEPEAVTKLLAGLPGALGAKA